LDTTITRNEITEGLNKIGCQDSTAEVQRIFEIVGAGNETATLEFSTFSAAVSEKVSLL